MPKIDKKKQYKASFNDVPFYINDVQTSGGHNIRKYEYPGDELGQSKHLSIKLKNYSVDGYVLTERARDLLVSVLDNAVIPRTLKHPTFGEIDCFCESYSISEKIGKERGMIGFSMVFVPSGLEDFIQSIKGLLKEISLTVDLVKLKIGAYREKLGLISPPSNFFSKIATQSQNFLNKKNEILASLKVPLNSQTRELNRVKQNLPTIGSNPINLSVEMNNISDSIGTGLADYSTVDRETVFTTDQKIRFNDINKRSLTELTDMINGQQETFESDFYKKSLALSMKISELASIINNSTELITYQNFVDNYTQLSADIESTIQLLYGLQNTAEQLYPDIFVNNEFADLAVSLKKLKNLYFVVYNREVAKLQNNQITATGQSIILLAFQYYVNLQTGIDTILQYNNIRNFGNVRGNILIK
jgi:hypothetical protein